MIEALVLTVSFLFTNFAPTCYEQIKKEKRLSLLLKMLEEDEYFSDILLALRKNKNITFFAPSNEAISKLSTLTKSQLASYICGFIVQQDIEITYSKEPRFIYLNTLKVTDVSESRIIKLYTDSNSAKLYSSHSEFVDVEFGPESKSQKNLYITNNVLKDVSRFSECIETDLNLHVFNKILNAYDLVEEINTRNNKNVAVVFVHNNEAVDLFFELRKMDYAKARIFLLNNYFMPLDYVENNTQFNMHKEIFSMFGVNPKLCKRNTNETILIGQWYSCLNNELRPMSSPYFFQNDSSDYFACKTEKIVVQTFSTKTTLKKIKHYSVFENGIILIEN